MSLLVQELAKPASERVEWFMWHDAHVVLLNPQIPLDVFLPPRDRTFRETHFIGSRVDGDFLPSVFFIHVHPWSIKLLVKAMAVPMIDELAELGSVMDQRALTYILNETDFRDSVVYQPWHWFDASSAGPKDDANRKGTMLAQFPTSLKGSRWKLMSDCLDGLEKVENGKMIPLEDSFYSKEITRWWDLAKDVLFMLLITTELQKNLHDWNEDVAWASASLAEVLSYGMDQRQLALETIQEAKHIVDNTKLPSKKLDAVDKGQWIEPL